MKNLQGRCGRYFITGNHEYYSGALPWVEEAKKLGFDVLLNEHRVIRQGGGTIILAGVTDASAGGFIPEHRSDPHKAIAGAPAADVKILLAHQPKSLYEGSKAGFDLQISGHTHGGQFFPWNLLATIGQPYAIASITLSGSPSRIEESTNKSVCAIIEGSVWRVKAPTKIWFPSKPS